MPGDEDRNDVLFILDTSTVSHIFRSYYRDLFPSFWERLDKLVETGLAVSVRAVRVELENTSRVPDAIGYLENLSLGFFTEPTEQEQRLVREMTNDPDLAAAANRWRSKEIDDADPYLIAKARASLLSATVVTEESQGASRTAGIPCVCRRFNVHCINLQQMMTQLGWRF